MLFAISEKNQIFYAGNAVKLEDVSYIIADANKKNKKPVIIQVDKWADATLLAKMITEAKICPKSFPCDLKSKMIKTRTAIILGKLKSMFLL